MSRFVPVNEAAAENVTSVYNTSPRLMRPSAVDGVRCGHMFGERHDEEP